MTPEERIAELEAQLAAEQAKNKNAKTPEIKVSAKRCVQINGIRRFPFTFYKSELKTILAMTDQLTKFMEDHDGELN